MNLVESYENIKPSIVAFASMFTFGDKPPEFPTIFGTGVIVEDGLVVTNNHVVNEFNKLRTPPNYSSDLWPVHCLLLHHEPDKEKMSVIKLEIIGVGGIKDMEHDEYYLGPEKPDVAIVGVKVKGLPKAKVKFDLRHIKEGRDVATAGFPMGTETLTAPGYLHQVTPTLQSGIISAVLPFPCKDPHALMINVMVQGGASGSPVFLPETGDVIGVINSSLNEISFSSNPNISEENNKVKPHFHQVNSPTNISYVVPSRYIEAMLEKAREDKRISLPEDTLTLEELIKSKRPKRHIRGKSGLTKWDSTDNSTCLLLHRMRHHESVYLFIITKEGVNFMFHTLDLLFGNYFNFKEIFTVQIVILHRSAFKCYLQFKYFSPFHVLFAH